MDIRRDQFLVDAERAFRASFPDRWEVLLRSAERAWAAPLSRALSEFPLPRTVLVRGKPVDVHSLSVRYLHAHVLETGTCWLNARFRAEQFRRRRAPGVLVVGIEELERMSQRSDVEEWSPAEEVTATLGTYRAELDVVWLQEVGADPFLRLAEIVADVDWDSEARYVPPED